MSDTTERHAFQTEVRELLDLMIHSLYSHKDIFLRELVSNASDALDKLRFEMLSRPELTPQSELEIRLEADKDARTLSIHDNGIGMSRDEVVSNIGTIARSGTREFLQTVRERKGDIVMLKEMLADGERALVLGHTDEERVVMLADSLHGDQGDGRGDRRADDDPDRGGEQDAPARSAGCR